MEDSNFSRCLCQQTVWIEGLVDRYVSYSRNDIWEFMDDRNLVPSCVDGY